LLDLHCVWEGRDLDHSWFTWWKTRAFKHLRALPLLVTWGVWLARNSFIFKGTPHSPEITAAKSVTLLPSFLSQSPRPSPSQPQGVVIDSASPWGFFDGASQQNICGGGGLLFLSASHYFIMTFGFRPGTNNFAELMSLKLLIAFTIEKGCLSLKVYGDSLNIINWIKGTQRCLNTRLAALVEDITRLQTSFDTFVCQHVYRENNKEADQRSKEELNLAMGQCKIIEHYNEQANEYLHRPFLD
jgi:ribonuclease HI